MMISRIIICILVMVLSGCSQSPPPVLSDQSLPHKTKSGIKIVKGQQDLRQLMWWKKMHDPILERLIEEALANNNQIQTAKANVLQAQAKLKEACFAWLPTLGISGTGFAARTWDADIKPQGVLAQTQAFSKLGNFRLRGYDSGFVPNYSLNILQNIKNNQYAKASLAMEKASYNATRLSIISQMAGAYFMLVGQREQYQDQLRYIHDLKILRQLEYGRFEDGAGDLTTVANLDQQIAVNQANLTSIENSISQVENAIQLLLNHNPGPVKQYGRINALSVQGLIPSNLSSAVLKNRPDILIAEANLKMSDANIGLAYSNFFPLITLTGILGRVSVDLSHLLKLNAGLTLAEGFASMPLLNGSAYEQIQVAKAGYKASYYNFIQTVKAAFADVDDSLTLQQKNDEAYAYQLKALKASKEAYELALNRYQNGAKDYREAINTRLTFDIAKMNANLAKMQQLDSLVGVYQALAGGYQEKCLPRKRNLKLKLCQG